VRREDAFQALEGLLRSGRPCLVEVRGVSMEPFLHAGDKVQVEAADPEGLVPGELIAFQEDGCLIVHRFAGWTGRGGERRLRQTGDNMPGYKLLDPRDLLGRVTAVERGGRRRRLDRGWPLAACRLRGWGLLAGASLRQRLGPLKRALLGRNR